MADENNGTGDDMPVPTQGGPIVSTISISSRIPAFWRDRPTLWFMQFEAITASQRTSDEQKAQLLIAHLEKQDLEQVSDLLTNLPATGKYEALKARLKDAYEESPARQLQRLLDEMELGDQKPSQLLRRMKDTARKTVPDETLRILWINRLPPTIRPILQASEKTAIDDLSKIADKVFECLRPGEVGAVASSSASPVDVKYRELEKEIAELKKLLMRRNFRSRQRSKSRTRNVSFHKDNMKDESVKPCFYQRRFGVEAKKCTQPCSFKAGN